jgi:hypothetical protein
MIVQELFTPKLLAANSSTIIFPANSTCSFGAFYCTAAGTVEIQNADGTDLIAAHAIGVAGVVLGGFICSNGLKITLTGGCAGTATVGIVG